MKNTELLSIKEFAKLAGVSQQAIYKAVQNRLNKYVETVNNQKMIDKSALKEIYGVEVEQPNEQKNNQVEQPEQPKTEAETMAISMLIEQLHEKDRQIEKLHQLIDQEQQLNMANSKKIIMLESKLKDYPETDQAPAEEQVVESSEQPKNHFGSEFSDENWVLFLILILVKKRGTLLYHF